MFLWSREGTLSQNTLNVVGTHHPTYSLFCSLIPQVQSPGMTPACQTCPSPVPSVHQLWGAPREGTATSWICLQPLVLRLRAGSLLQASPGFLKGPGLARSPYSARPKRSCPPPLWSCPQPPRRAERKTRPAMAPSAGAEE